MFRWYQKATKCYFYLSDVSRSISDLAEKPNEPWEATFRKSRWFTRGWTLQELIAPASVDFFSKEGELLGNKKSLEQHICAITGIPAKALNSGPLSDFSITERMLWTASRETTRQEDMAYSLLGIFDVNMPLVYGEGKEKALKRLREEIDKASKGLKREDYSITFSLSIVSNVEHFVGRKAELAEMHKALSGDGSRRVVILHGLGGIGTQLSIKYAKRHRNNYSAIFWLNFKDEKSLKQSFVKVAKRILREHPSESELGNVDTQGNLDKVVDAVKSWLSLPNNTRWLMICDSYDNPKLPRNKNLTAVDIQKFVPESYHGSIIITTRLAQVQFGHPIQIRKLGHLLDSLEILSNMSRRKGLIDDPDAKKLAKELDGLPLALATAGAYLYQVSISISGYLRLYKESWVRLQKSSPGLSSYEDRTLYSTWQISFNHVKQQNELSAKLLCFWAYFDSQDLWLELLQHGDSNDPEWVRELAEDEASFHSTMRVLCNHGLVEEDMSSQELIESRGYSMHSCVHSWTIHVLNQTWDYDLARLAVKFVGSHVLGEQTVRPLLTPRRLLQHATRCSSMVLDGLVPEDGIARSYYNLGLLYADQGELFAAEQIYQFALQGNEKVLGTGDILTLQTVCNLGMLYRVQGKLDKAEIMYRRALQGFEEALGAEHTSTLEVVNNLAVLYGEQSRLDEAETRFLRVLQGFEEALGAEHPSTLGTVNNLGTLYAHKGELAKAEQVLGRALQGKEKVLGPEDLSTLNTVNNLGNIYALQSKFDKAELVYLRALQGYEKARCGNNITTYIPALHTLIGLGSLFKRQGNLAKARMMYSDALAGYEKVVGPDHPTCQKLRRKLQALKSKL